MHFTLHVNVNSCYAFEPLESQADSLERDELIMFPNQDAAKLRFYLSTCINDITSLLIEDFEAYIRNLKPNAPLSTPLQPNQSSSSAPNDGDASAKVKKLRAARREKHIGDYCLLAGTPQDALLQYVIPTLIIVINHISFCR
jgi:hypothetical protein